MADSIFDSFPSGHILIENRTFDEILIEQDFEREKDITFNNCTFKEFASFENFKSRGFSFNDCHFDKGLYIGKSIFYSISFYKCDANHIDIVANESSNIFLRELNGNRIEINGDYEEISFIKSTAEEMLLNNVNSIYSHRGSSINFRDLNVFKKTRIECSANFSMISFKGGTYDSVFFEGEFKKKVLFSGKFQIKNLYLDTCVFSNRIDFEKGIFEHVSFYRSLFKGLVLINDVDYLSNIPRKLEIQDLTLHSCTFDKDITINIRKIKRFDTSNCNYLEVLNVNNFTQDKSNLVMIGMSGVNKGTIIFEKSFADFTFFGINLANIFLKDLDISSFYLSEFQNTGSLSFLNIKSGQHFVIQDSISGNLNFLNSDINVFGEIIIANSNIDGASFNRFPKKILAASKFPITGYGITDKSSKNHNLKNVYNQLKKNARLKGDIDSANKFESLEHRKLLLSKKLSFDSFLLFFNLISNNNGRSWFQGIIFTLAIGLLFFILYLNTLGIRFTTDGCYQDYVLFITSFPKLEVESYYNESWITQLVIWFGRIFISYGIYQTIASFRKYGKA